MLASLEPAQRYVLELVYFSGLTMHDVAERTGDGIGATLMPVRANIPNVGAVNFPDGMSEDDIHTAVDRRGLPRILQQQRGRTWTCSPVVPRARTWYQHLRAIAQQLAFRWELPRPGLLAPAWPAPLRARVLAPIAKKYGIKAPEGAGLGTGYELYRELKKVFEGE